MHRKEVKYMAKYIATIRGSGTVKLPPKCDVDVWGIDPRDCECPKHKIVHGKTCPKQPHVGSGYLHSQDDDTRYYVDDTPYCGRCHSWIA